MDNKITRLRRRYQGLSRVAAAINDLYIYGVYPGNFPNLVQTLEDAKDKVKEVILETKQEIASIEGKEPEEEMQTDPFKAFDMDNYRV